ncbi:hypothetical protein [Curtobacterium sp. Leaf261]|uniref:hypothetical protein n=1 Tax=Curtobacterium sp. Leaf261 TaxID=1736311 RepID=UPI000A6D935C|nr:hypothetical protein [Curtobacterium sp. Leaf261]
MNGDDGTRDDGARDGGARDDGARDDGARYDGFTLDELNDYLDDDRTPANPAIDASPEAGRVLDRLAALRDASWQLLEADATAHETADRAWIDRVLASVRGTARAGRDVPVPDPDPAARLIVTEGAIRAAVRHAGDAVEGVVVRRVRLRGDVTIPGVPIDVDVTASIEVGRPIAPITEALHAAAAEAIGQHAPFPVGTLTVHVVDVHGPEDRA